MFYQPSRTLHTNIKYGSAHSEVDDKLTRTTNGSSGNSKSGRNRKSTSLRRMGTVNRQRWSFLVVLFFFGLSTLIILMSNLSTSSTGSGVSDLRLSDTKNGDWGNKKEENENSGPSVAFWDVAYEDGSVNHQNPSLFLQDDERETGRRTLLVNNIPITHDWQQVLGTAEKFFVYSAYLVNNELQNP